MKSIYDLAVAAVLGVSSAPWFLGAPAAPAVSSAYIECEGCTASAGIRAYTYRSDGANPPNYFWDSGVGGTITYTIGPKTEDHGQCIPEEDECVPDPEDGCLAKQSITITGGGLMNRFSSGASGCVEFDDLTSAQKNITASSKVCDGAEQQSQFFGYMSSSCAGPNLNDEKIVVFAKCSECVEIESPQ